MKKIKRLLASLMVVAMLLTTAPLSGFVEIDISGFGNSFYAVAKGGKYSGTCGENLTWTLDTTVLNSVLVISGTGEMDDYYSEYDLPWFKHRSSIYSVSIEDGVTSIGDYAFAGLFLLKNITISDTVMNIGKGTFSGCNKLESVSIPDSVTCISDSTFAGCSSLHSVSIPDSVTSIGNEAFLYCDSIIEVIIPDGVTSIGNDAFSGCHSLTEITIPDSVISIGKDAFYCSESLVSITVDADNEVYSNDSYGVLYNKAKTEIIKYPEGKKDPSYTLPDSVINIGDRAFVFSGNLKNIIMPACIISIGNGAFLGTGLTDMEIPDSVTSIGNRAFAESKLTSITISDTVTEIGDSAFTYCYNLKNVTLPAGIKSIDIDMFRECTSLENITIPDGVTDIKEQAFSYCSNLKKINIPASVTSIAESAFWGCESLTGITVDVTNTVYSSDQNGVLFNKDKTELILYPKGSTIESYIIPNSVTYIGDAFHSCFNLKSIIISEGITVLDERAFYDCEQLVDISIHDGIKRIGEYVFYNTGYYNVDSNWDNGVLYIGNHLIEAKTALSGNYSIREGTRCIADCAFSGCEYIENIVIPDSVTSIGKYALSWCKGLEEITLGKNVAYIGDHTFDGCISLNNFLVSDSNTFYSNDEYGVLFNKDKTKVIRYPENKISDRYIVPNSVYEISVGAFYRCFNLKTVSIPDGVTGIPDEAFRYSGLESIIIPEGVTSIGEYAFGNCDISSVVIPDGVKSIGYSAFESCDKLINISLPDSIISIGNSVFNLTGYAEDESNWENGVLYIDNHLISVNSETSGDYSIKSGTRCIADSAFYGCRINSVEIPESVKHIGSHTFYCCYNLTDVTIPVSITSVENYAFYECENLSNVYYGGTQAEWEKIVIEEKNDPLLSASVYFKSSSTVVLGDPTGDNKINSSDALVCLQHSVGKIKLEGEIFVAADVDKDGLINSSDALKILQFAVGKIDTL